MAERVEVFKDTGGDWWWRKIASNENKVATSREGYENKLHAVKMAKQENEGVEIYLIDEQPLPPT